ncbi:MAG: Serine acetyltransferase [Firmicutes bacterium ADurb.Bin248]|nr:MAG: Serine acetyltransferase [Firmicutes bacterium ADurb.Bin248]HOG00285.1 DapH/DapD/GlmU-related protein [Clostridia bacterium]HPK15772.1 DapH/DapD/GlmU-related protein [Clostridia bacterium]
MEFVMDESAERLAQSVNTASRQLAQHNASNRDGSINRPGLKEKVARFIQLVRSAMYPQVFGTEVSCANAQSVIGNYLSQAALSLGELLCAVDPDGAGQGGVVTEFVKNIPAIAEVLETDIAAAYEGDPAARSKDEIMLAYPAFEAISVFRLAHRLYELNVPLLPRMMTEYAHQLTGIDIHPGARIGNYFFIDHGTGVVIGETCTIGERVKLYQGVTLGAKSFDLDENGNPVKGIKRHPDIGDNVVIYAGATILGGQTRIGDNCVVGGNVWLTRSVEPGQTVYYNVNNGGNVFWDACEGGFL